jgi:hypothetical protein
MLMDSSVICEYTYNDSVEVVIFKDRNWRWFQFKKAKQMKNQGFDKYSYKTSIKFSNPETKTSYIKSVIKGE